jgi:hypothetical protein
MLQLRIKSSIKCHPDVLNFIEKIPQL